MGERVLVDPFVLPSLITPALARAADYVATSCGWLDVGGLAVHIDYIDTSNLPPAGVVWRDAEKGPPFIIDEVEARGVEVEILGHTRVRLRPYAPWPAVALAGMVYSAAALGALRPHRVLVLDDDDLSGPLVGYDADGRAFMLLASMAP